MNKKNVMREFIKDIEENKLLTRFIINIFDYENFNGYNYLFRMIDSDEEIIIDIYDNVSNNRFNRYIFYFGNDNYDFRVVEEGNVFVSYISIINVCDSKNKLLKLAYLFRIDDCKMIEYAETFLDDIFVKILEKTIKRPI